MKTDTLRLRAPIGNGAFIAFIFSIFGWALIQAWFVRVAAPIVLQALAALLGISLAAIGHRRYRMQWLALPPAQPQSNRHRLLLDGACLLLLLVTGYILGQLVLSVWMSPLLIFAIGLTFAPWSRVPLCRRSFLVSGILFGAGAAYPLLFPAISSADPLRLLVAAWALWAAAVFALLHKY
jgi:hypothetical protein